MLTKFNKLLQNSEKVTFITSPASQAEIDFLSLQIIFLIFWLRVLKTNQTVNKHYLNKLLFEKSK